MLLIHFLTCRKHSMNDCYYFLMNALTLNLWVRSHLSNLLSLGRVDLEKSRGEINLTGAGEEKKKEKGISSHLNPESEALADGFL